MISNVVKPLQIVLTTAVLLAVLVIFISPFTDILPAPQLKHSPANDFTSVLLIAFFLFVPQMGPVVHGHPVVQALHQSSERLELICTLRR